MPPKNRWNSNLLSGLLLVSLVVLLYGYLQVVNILPSLIYSPSQQEFLSYNEQRKVWQAPLYSNIIKPTSIPMVGGGNDDHDDLAQLGNPVIQPANFSVWENQVQAILTSHYEEQNGVSVTMYDLDFQSDYHFQYHQTNASPMTTTLELIFPFPSNLETLHEVRFLVDGHEPADVQYTPEKIHWMTVVRSGENHDVAISYKANGVGSFSYGLSKDRRTDALAITITVAGLRDNQVSRQSLPPTAIKSTDNGQTFTWHYANLVADRDIQLGLLLSGTFMFAYAKRPLPPEPEPEIALLSIPQEPQAEPPPITVVLPLSKTDFIAYCPQCGRGQMEDYDFCPACGYDGQIIKLCESCGHQQVVLAESAKTYCLHCGKIITINL